MILFKKKPVELAAQGFAQFEHGLAHKNTPDFLQIKEVTKLHLKNFCAGFAGGLLASGYDNNTILKTLKILVHELRKKYNLEKGGE